MEQLEPRRPGNTTSGGMEGVVMRKVEFDRMQDLRSMMMAVAFAASTDDERPDMNGVGLEVFKGELHARATNGEWAMRVRRKPVYADEGFKALIPLSHVKRLVALIGDGIGHVGIIHDQDRVRFEVAGIGQLYVNTGGVAAVPFVDIDGAWPTGEALPMETIGLNPSLMASLAKAFGQLAEKPTLRFAFHGDEHPVVVTCKEKENVDALLMPCTLEGAGDEDDDERHRQRTLFPEPDEGERAKAVDGIREALRGASNSEPSWSEVTISSGRSVKLKSKTEAKAIGVDGTDDAMTMVDFRRSLIKPVRKGASAKKKKKVKR
jgi:hypothetical protein